MIKIAGVCGLALLFLIPLAFVADLIEERESMRDRAVWEIGSSWAHQQKISGPFLWVPFEKRVPSNKENSHTIRVEQAVFLPDELNIDCKIEVELRKRGIFETAVFRAHLHISGFFSAADFKLLNTSVEHFLWEDAVLAVGITDTRGIEGKPRLLWRDQGLDFRPAPGNIAVLEQGLHVPVSGAGGTQSQLPFEFDLVLRGTKGLSFAPTAKQTVAGISSAWPDPSFVGAFLPATRKVSKDGFQASWSVSHLARSYPQSWRSCKVDLESMKTQLDKSFFGVEVLQSLDLYRKVMRSVKYGVLFVGFTFLGFFLFEILTGSRIHPIQYSAVGAALGVFYLLLLSFSEHLGFGNAFLIASVTNVLLITGYSKAFLMKTRRLAGLAAILSGLYLFLYLLLQVEDYALLVGSIAVFVCLGVFMYLTRKLDWYAVSLTQRQSGVSTRNDRGSGGLG